MSWQSFIMIFSVLTLFFSKPTSATETSQDTAKVLKELVSNQRTSAGLVGLGAIIIQDGKIIGASVSGERKKGSQVLLTEQDKWHIGSITKSFTATMIGRLVEKGILNWNTPVKEVLSDASNLHRDWQNVTLEQLLTHTSGAAPNFPLLVNFKRPAEGSERMKAREAAVLDILKKAPKNTPGSTFTYSNIGYTIAGVIAEKETGIPWEMLIQQEVFVPLKLQSSGFGPPQDEGEKLSQPRGHKNLFGMTLAASPQEDNSPIIGPAGTIHLSLEDLARYANEHLQGELGRSSLLKPETFQKLHTPLLNSYAYGWVVRLSEDSPVSPVIWHNGSNTMWYALVTFSPSINTVIAITSNDGKIKAAEQAAWKIVDQVAQLIAMPNNKSPQQTQNNN